MQRCVLGSCLQCRLELRDGGIEIGFLKIGDPKVCLVTAVVWTGTQRCLEFTYGVAGIARLDQSEPETVVRVRIVRLELHQFPERCHRSFAISRPLEEQPQVVLAFGQIGL